MKQQKKKKRKKINTYEILNFTTADLILLTKKSILRTDCTVLKIEEQEKGGDKNKSK